ncbi:hypothetical protein AAFF_G00201160 [Aldrovandia affinis]|uniref:Uncharacterized protein n=1 Tax=Aldrovandia affinis TaxID=143900 RepID=A0AAD7R0V6_9TELE|nr:hypothetical protein AAFF_G00201160 [Aldrovandia affinis]
MSLSVASDFTLVLDTTASANSNSMLTKGYQWVGTSWSEPSSSLQEKRTSPGPASATPSASVQSPLQPALTFYSGDMVHCVNTNSVKVVHLLIPTPCKVHWRDDWCGLPAQADSKETSEMLEDLVEEEEEDKEDEGFEEDYTLYQTVSSLLDETTTSLPSSSIQPAASSIQPAASSIQSAASSIQPAASILPAPSSIQSAANPPGVPGAPPQVPEEQLVGNIVALWQNLLDYDKQRVVFAARHQDRLNTWPDCSRLIEAIIVSLCGIHKSPKKQGKGTLTRWTLILQDYRKIRQLILANRAIMQDTTLQLVEVNQTTLIQWHNRRVKKQDTSLVLQGIDLPNHLSVAVSLSCLEMSVLLLLLNIPVLSMFTIYLRAQQGRQ